MRCPGRCSRNSARETWRCCTFPERWDNHVDPIGPRTGLPSASPRTTWLAAFRPVLEIPPPPASASHSAPPSIRSATSAVETNPLPKACPSGRKNVRKRIFSVLQSSRRKAASPAKPLTSMRRSATLTCLSGCLWFHCSAKPPGCTAKTMRTSHPGVASTFRPILAFSDFSNTTE